MINKELVKSRFEKSIETYDQNAVVQKFMAHELTEKISKFCGTDFEKIFEFGSGTGFLTSCLAEKMKFSEYYANDIVEKSESFIKNIIPDAIFFKGDIETINIENKFDLIVSNASMQWISNIAQLLEKLNLPANHPAIPDVNMLVVLGKTKNILPPDMQNHEGDTEEQKQAKEVIARIYEMMLDKQNCSKEECYWIPNKLQQYPSVREAVLSAGFNSVEDPLNLYNKWVSELEKEIMEETQDDESVQRFLDMQKALSQNAPAYIPVTRAQMEELNRRNDDRKLMDPKTRKDHIVFYVPDPQNARDMMDVFHEHPAFLLWGKDGKVFDRDADLNTADRANILQDDVTQRAQEMATFAKGVVQEMYQENLKDSSRRQTRKISNMNAKQASQELQKKLPDNKKPSGGKGLSGKTPALQFKELKL